MAELTSLKRRRGQLKAQLTRFKTFIEDFDNDRVLEIPDRIKVIDETWAKFNNIQQEIMEVKAKDSTEIDLEEENEQMEFEDIYFHYKAAATSIWSWHTRQLNQLSQSNESLHDQNIQSGQEIERGNANHKSSIKLPTLTLPVFSGEYSRWLSFKDAFLSLIDKNETLNDTQRFQYLRSSLQGEALQTIESLETSAESYKIAWKLLTSHYDNSRLIVNTHLKQLIDAPSIAKDNKFTIRSFVNHIRTHVKSLESLKLPIDQWDAILIYLVTSKLDFSTRKEWERHVGNRAFENWPKLSELLDFLTEKYHTLEMIEKEKPNQDTKLVNIRKMDKRVTMSATVSFKCEYCGSSHNIYSCSEFLKLPVPVRIQEVKKLQLCLNCLRKGHLSKDCRASACKRCNRHHNTKLHMESGSHTSNREAEEGSSSISPQISTDEENRNKQRVLIANGTQQSSNIFLSTALVYILDDKGRKYQIRVLLDSGSQSNIITGKLVEKMGLKTKRNELAICGVNQATTVVHKSVTVKIESRIGNDTFELSCLVLPEITGNVPQVHIPARSLKIPPNLRLADETYHTPGNIDLLIGSGLFWNILLMERMQVTPNQPILQNTRLGWIIGGEMVETRRPTTDICLLITNQELHEQMERFWQIEEIPKKEAMSKTDLECEEYFVATTKRDIDGRFIVCLPKDDTVVLGNSLQTAEQRLRYLKKRLDRHEELKNDYNNFMKEYKDLSHLSPLRSDENFQEVYYLPHHPVLKNESLTTKLRVVFDGSSKSESGKSLNDKLIAGPSIQDNLFDVTLRFRTYNYVLTADIKMMYRQILVDNPDRHLQRILWYDEHENARHFVLNTITYGTAPASFIATRCLKELASQERINFPAASSAVMKDFYMDDLLTGASTVESAATLQMEIEELLGKGKFQLRKWRSNCETVLSHLQNDVATDHLLILNKHELLKTLGLFWNANEDIIQYQVPELLKCNVTKRKILSQISKIFDPLGLLGPILIRGKILMQTLWKLKVGWDEAVPPDIEEDWIKYCNSLSAVHQFQIPRQVNPRARSDKISIHGFSDASEKAYGACIYVVSVDESGTITSRLMCAKSKVAHLSSLALPRLELCAALLLARLTESMMYNFSLKIEQIHLWTDSTIVLAWINTPPHRLKTFVSHRVAKIQSLTRGANWRHVPSTYNPSDLLSRGISAGELRCHQMWWSGPDFLASATSWSEINQSSDDRNHQSIEIPEVKSQVLFATSKVEFPVLKKFSSFDKLKRVIAYCRRVFLKKNDRPASLVVGANELVSSSMVIARIVQQECFPIEWNNLKRNKSLPPKSRLWTLNPFLDERDLLRVGGRLQNAHISESQQHPILLPPKHHITTIIMRQKHIEMFHCGPEHLLSEIRKEYWPISGRREAREVTR